MSTGGTESTAKFAGLAVAGLALLLCLPCLLCTGLGGAAVSTPEDTTGATGHQLREGAPVPGAYLAWVLRAGNLCPEIGPAEIAAQIDLESSWNPNAYADSGEVPAKGIAQFTDATWASWGRDYDGDGTNSAYDPEDAILAQGLLMCDLVAWAKNLVAAGRLRGDLLDLAWAAYYAGRGGVESAGGVPAAGPAHDYPGQIRTRLARYAADTAGPGGAGWRLPVPAGAYTLSSGFGPRWGTFHYGQDFAAPAGTPVYAAAAGVVIESDCTSPYCDRPGGLNVPGCGWTVAINHGDGLVTRYCHLRVTRVTPGQRLAPGEVIGQVGSTGNSDGPHLHFEVHVGAPPATGPNAIDPIQFLKSVGVAV